MLAAIGACGHPAFAEPLAFKCEELDAGGPAQMTLNYEGDESGTLKLKASFGADAKPTLGQEMDPVSCPLFGTVGRAF